MKKGRESLMAAVQKDTGEGNNCFNAAGCDKERHKILPQDNPRLVEMGIQTMCVAQTKCTHDYCGKYKWVLDRAEMYAKFIGCTADEVLEAWENDRTYWHQNYYQECNQPEIKAGGPYKVVKVKDWLSALQERFGKDPKNWKFVCPACGNIQSGQDFIDAGKQDYNGILYSNCITRYTNSSNCKWSLSGLLQIHSTVVISDKFQVIPVFEMAPDPRLSIEFLMDDTNSGKIFNSGIVTMPELDPCSIRWIAKVGSANDWAIYYHKPDMTDAFIKAHGIKVKDEANIRKLVPCTDEALKKYRH